MKNNLFALIITGPTASGKTSLSYDIAQNLSSEVINIDMGQFYTPLTVGTAKPDWQNNAVQAWMFDILNTPENLSVFRYQNLVLEKIKNIQFRNKLPIIVGGTLFYIKSLFFPPKPILQNNSKSCFSKTPNVQRSWKFLNTIDSERAKKIHPHDTYRINRAIDIWEKTGEKPSIYFPKFAPLFNSIVISLTPDKDVLQQRIHKRTNQMINKEGWIEEAEGLAGTVWEQFILSKGFIGYREIFSWIKKGKQTNKLSELIDEIKQKTRFYAKRQMTFIRSLLEHLKNHEKESTKKCVTINGTIHDVKKMISMIRDRTLA
jgi:tRNA dimethylallyltransferase